MAWCAAAWRQRAPAARRAACNRWLSMHALQPSRPLQAGPLAALRPAARRALGVRSAMAVVRGDAAHGGHRLRRKVISKQLFVHVICDVCRMRGVWDAGRDTVPVGALFIMYCYHTYAQQPHFFIEGALRHSLACVGDPLRDRKRRMPRSKEATRITQAELRACSITTIEARNRGGTVHINHQIEHEWPDHRP